MAKDKSYTFTKNSLNKLKTSESKMTPEQKRSVSKAIVNANTEANTPRKKKKA